MWLFNFGTKISTKPSAPYPPPRDQEMDILYDMIIDLKKEVYQLKTELRQHKMNSESNVEYLIDELRCN
jgi:hypothetical protein